MPVSVYQLLLSDVVTFNYFYTQATSSPPSRTAAVPTIVMSVYLCLSVCLSAGISESHASDHLNQLLRVVVVVVVVLPSTRVSMFY